MNIQCDKNDFNNKKEELILEVIKIVKENIQGLKP